ncbi:MAG: S46 family peptidase [Acidobacteriota bacterium]|nr:MAG: S46 family peptidase [Acidobacteriota bacterium]
MKQLVLFALAITTTTALAGEGMWAPDQLPQLADQLRALGLEVDPAQLDDLTAHPMNAVISLGGCTASFVSPEGLVITNHHCAHGSIQYNSTEENNLLQRGFLATDKSAELPAGPGSRVFVTVSSDDVTDTILEGLDETLSGRERYQRIDDREKALVAECEQENGYRCRVSSFHGGLFFKLIKQLEIRDGRLVYAPAGSIGNFGGDVDNWMWPRHTGDFSFYRAYVGPDGKPADYAEQNVPFRPKHFLEVSTEGLKTGDFVMAAGYPGRTHRYRLARELEQRIAWYYPTLKRAFDDRIDVVQTATTGRPETAIKYAGMVEGLNNASKNYQGMLDGFAKSDVLQRKKKREQELLAWIEVAPQGRSEHGAILERLEQLVDEYESFRERELYYGMARRPAMLSTARTLYRLSRERQKPDEQREPGYQKRDELRIRERMVRLDRRFDPDVDRALLRHAILRYSAIDTAQHVTAFDAWFGIEGTKIERDNLDMQLDEMYSKTRLGDQRARLAWLDKDAVAFEQSDDPFIKLAVHLFDSDIALEEREKRLAGEFQWARSRYMEALIAQRRSQGLPVYADANGTLRVTVGKVAGYSPRDAVVYAPFTTLRGIVQKNSGEEPFDSPRLLLDAIATGEFGPYEERSLGSVPVNFLSTLDSTGGNSGSPTLNSKAELVGLLFDGNYESINADWDFDTRIVRAIHVDVRYVLWVMQYVDRAHELLREMGLRIDM